VSVSTSRAVAVIRQVRGLLSAREAARLSDRDLLRRFAECSDEAAFAAIVRRHGPMVLRVSGGILRHGPDAEDVFQAAFLALARRAGSAGWHDSVAGWLHVVTRRLALRVRGEIALRPAREAAASVRPGADPLDVATGRELCAALDEEIARLPARCRSPLVLCCLEAVTRDEAARQLGWSLGTLKRRLERGRSLLRLRLERRGFTVPAALGAASLALGTHAALAAPLARSAVTTAARPATAPARVLALARSVPRGIFSGSTRAILAAVTLLCLTATGLLPAAGPKSVADPPAPARPAGDEASRHEDLLGDPLPFGALARIGSVRWRLGPGGAESVGFSPDGKTIVTANSFYGVTVWDVATGRVLREVPIPPDDLSAAPPVQIPAALSADGSTLAWLSKDNVVCVADVASGKTRQRFPVGGPENVEIALTANGRVLLARAGETLEVWDTLGGARLLRTKVPGQGPPTWQGYRNARLAVTPDGKTFAWVEGEKGGTVHVCDTATGGERLRLKTDEGPNPRIVLSPGGDKLLSSCERGETRLWDLKTGRVLHKLAAIGTHQTVAAFAPDGNSLVAISPEVGLLRVDIASGREVWHRLQGAWFSSKTDVLAYAPDGKSVVAVRAGFEHVLFRYDAATGEVLKNPNERADSFSWADFSPDGRSLFTLHGQGEFCTWDPATGRRLRSLRGTSGAVSLSSDGRFLAAIAKKTVHIYSAETGREERSFPTDSPGYSAPLISPDTRTLVLMDGNWGKDLHLSFHETATGKLVARTEAVKSGIVAQTFTPDGRYVAAQLANASPTSIEIEPRVHFFDAATGKVVRSLDIGSSFDCVLFSPDGKTLVTVSKGGPNFMATFREEATGRVRLEIGPLTMWRSPLTFSRDGRLFADGAGDGSVRVWDAFRGILLRRIDGHRGQVTDLSFARDGRRLVSTSYDTTALVWDLAELGIVLGQAAPKLRPAQLASLWDDLSGSDAAKAYRAIGALARSPAESIPFLREKVRPAATVDLGRLSGFLKDLDAEAFGVRERAEREIARMGDQAESALRRVLDGSPSAEVKARVGRLLEATTSGEVLAGLRAVEVLEHAATPEARRLLDALAGGAAEARLTREAKASRERLGRRAEGL
jgi:RNA polymerase sigma factor (sigma-70 family)